jgi:hypothetical protein
MICLEKYYQSIPHLVLWNHVATNACWQGILFFVFHNRISHCFDLAEASEEQVLKLQGLDIILEHVIYIKQLNT